MENNPLPIFSVSDFLAAVNQTLEYAYPVVEVEGEVSSFKINQNKFVFFDVKDAGGTIGCFMTVWQLRIPIEDGMKVIVRAMPKLTPWGKFSLTVQAVRPSGEGSLKKSYELLKAKLEKEGLFALDRKRTLPALPQHIAVISSVQAAGYADFVKILNERWGGVRIEVANVQVQGDAAPDQIIRAIRYFNQLESLPEVLVIIRGGGSADDLRAFNDELLVREIAASRIPTLVGVGHEIDESLADLAADVRAATPSNAAQIVVPDRHEYVATLGHLIARIFGRIDTAINILQKEVQHTLQVALTHIDARINEYDTQIVGRRQILLAYNPMAVLARGYAIVRGEVVVGKTIRIEQQKELIEAEVTRVDSK
ncbi:exodeoxyribonuclease VII large subunit [Candidatus Saccharibacteria bacterium]|nr:exodeoxyribonuclease VII large subunit [Candidatus Saccharibacteria bacterium]